MPKVCRSSAWCFINNSKTYRRPWGSFLSGGTRGAHGNVPIERTSCSTRPLYWVGKGGHLLQDHFLTDLNHMFSWKRWTLCEKSLLQTSLQVIWLRNRSVWSNYLCLWGDLVSEFIATLNVSVPVTHTQLWVNEKLATCVLDSKCVTKKCVGWIAIELLK